MNTSRPVWFLRVVVSWGFQTFYVSATSIFLVSLNCNFLVSRRVIMGFTAECLSTLWQSSSKQGREESSGQVL